MSKKYFIKQYSDSSWEIRELKPKKGNPNFEAPHSYPGRLPATAKAIVGLALNNHKSGAIVTPDDAKRELLAITTKMEAIHKQVEAQVKKIEKLGGHVEINIYDEPAPARGVGESADIHELKAFAFSVTTRGRSNE